MISMQLSFRATHPGSWPTPKHLHLLSKLSPPIMRLDVRQCRIAVKISKSLFSVWCHGLVWSRSQITRWVALLWCKGEGSICPGKARLWLWEEKLWEESWIYGWSYGFLILSRTSLIAAAMLSFSYMQGIALKSGTQGNFLCRRSTKWFLIPTTKFAW